MKLIRNFRRIKKLIVFALIIYGFSRFLGYMDSSTNAVLAEIEKSGSPIGDTIFTEDTVVSTAEKVMDAVSAAASAADMDVCPVEKANVVSVTDGDTIRVMLGNTEVPVRLIGVNTPESSAGVASGYVETEEAYGEEASGFTKSILKKGDTIWLTKDTSDADRYGRLLRIVWIREPEETDFSDIDKIREKTLQGKLLSEGYAEVMTVEPDTAYHDIFVKLQSEAMQKESGMWYIKTIEKEKGR